MNVNASHLTDDALNGILEAMRALSQGKFKQARSFVMPEDADATIKAMGETLLVLMEQMEDVNRYATDLARGMMRTDSPGPQNRLANGLKALQNALLHLIWQARQVAAGDYTQKVEFLGELSDVFNVMICQLDEREKALHQEIETHRQMEESLQQSYQLLLAATDSAGQWVFFVDADSKEVTFSNENARQAMERCGTNSDTPCQAVQQILSSAASQNDWEVHCTHCSRWLSVSSSTGLRVGGRITDVHIASDITQRKENEQRLLDQAMNDPLTGLLNRRASISVLNEWLSEGQAFSLCFIDLDDLKYINDTFGHAEGDAALRVFSTTATGMVRSRDRACRYAGDEFLILLPDCPIDEATHVVERLSVTLKEKESQYPLGFSYGIVEHIPGADATAESIIDQADQAMYEMKQEHRKRRRSTFRS